MLLVCRNGFEQQTQSSSSLLSPQDHMVIFKCQLYSLLKTHIILYAYNTNSRILLVVHSIPYSHKISLIKIQLPESKKQVTFTTNNSPHWGLTVSCFGIRTQQCSLYHCPATPKQKMLSLQLQAVRSCSIKSVSMNRLCRGTSLMFCHETNLFLVVIYTQRFH